MAEPKRRGRPRKSSNPLSVDGESAFNSQNDIEEAIDGTQFEFYNPTNESMPEIGNFNPLGESAIERDYATPHIQDGIVKDLEEPSFHQKSNPFGNNQGNDGNQNNSQGSPNGYQGSSDPMMNPNPAMNQLDDKEKMMAATQMADAMIDTYETVMGYSGKLAQQKESKVQELIDDGVIDANRRIPVDEDGNTVGVMEFVKAFNDGCLEAGKVAPSFKKKVRTPLIRICSKRGWGMSDEQLIAFAVVQDVSIRAATLYAMNKNVKEILNRMIEENAENRNQKQKQAPPRPQPKPQAQPQPQPQSEYIEPEVEEMTDNDLAYLERIRNANAERDRLNKIQQMEDMRKEQEEKGITKMNINFDDNPMRDTSNMEREYPEPKVEEYFEEGREIDDSEESETNNDYDNEGDS